MSTVSMIAAAAREPTPARAKLSNTFQLRPAIFKKPMHHFNFIRKFIPVIFITK